MLPDSARRATRTLVQTSLAGSIIALLAAFHYISWTETQTVLVMAVATPVIGFIQNLLEDRDAIPKLLKPPMVEVPAPAAG